MAEAKLSGPMKLLQKKLYERVAVHDTGSPEEQRLRVGALNVDSIIREERCQKVQALITDNCFDIFATIETKLQKDDHTGDQWDLDGYSYVRKDRIYNKKQTTRTKTKNTNEPTKPNPPGAQGGGILIYIHNAVRYKVKSRGEYAESNVEFLHIEITSPVQLHLVALYSPEKILVDHLISLMSYFMEPLGDKKIMFIGDTNIDKYGVQPQDNLGNTFFDVLKREYKVEQPIDKVTYIGQSTKKSESNGTVQTSKYSCIDHIFTNLNVPESGVMKNSVAAPCKYHEGIYCTLPVSLQYWTFRNKVHKRLRRIPQKDACILAFFCEFQQADEVRQVESPLLRYVKGNESVYCMEFKSVAELDNGKLQKFISKIVSSQHLLRDNEQQWTIFTRNKASILFTKLYKCSTETMKVSSRKFTYETYPQKGVGNTTYDAQEAAEGDVQAFMHQLVDLLNKSTNSCILAVFYQFPSGADASNITPKEDDVITYPHERELACYIMVDDVDEVENRIRSIEHSTEDVSDDDGANAAATHKQCIIFTRDSRSPVFDALQKKMWYKDWDFVWQPRHVEFLGYVLEPSLTYAYRDGEDPIGNDEQLSQEQAIALQECTYRYWSENWKYIERM